MSADPGLNIHHPLTYSVQPLRASAVSHGDRTGIGSHAVPQPLQGIDVSAPIQHQETFGITEGCNEHHHLDYFIKSGQMTAIPPTDSFFDIGQRSAEPSQVKRMVHNVPTPRPQLHQPPQPSRNAHSEAQSPVNTNAGHRHTGSTVQEVDETFSEYALAAVYHLPAVPDWGQLFREWLQARRRWARDHRFNDPVLVGLLLARAFDAWLRPLWPLLYNQGLSGPTESRSRWIHLFDFWLLMRDAQELLMVQQPLSPTVRAPTHPTTHPAPIPILVPSIPLPSTPIPTRASRRNVRNATSHRTVVAIQQECEKRGGEKEAIQKLETVFPANTVVSRDALKVTRRSTRRLTRRSRGSMRNHQGYLEFVGRREVQHYCRLCGPSSKLWKNEKDLLNHVWNIHCDY